MTSVGNPGGKRSFDSFPSYIFSNFGGLGAGGVVKVTDTGMGGRGGSGSGMSGTAGYAAPEVWEGAPASVRADLYSVGATLYRVLGGRRLVENEHPSAALATLSSALEKLQVHREQEGKRSYWRDKFLKRRIQRVSRSDAVTAAERLRREEAAFDEAGGAVAVNPSSSAGREILNVVPTPGTLSSCSLP